MTTTTEITILRPGAEPERQAVPDLPQDPGYDRLSKIVRPILGCRHMERVRVLHEGQYLDMFVDETGALDGLERNEAATAIYRNNWLTQHPEDPPESLPAIYGPAVLFSRPVWR